MIDFLDRGTFPLIIAFQPLLSSPGERRSGGIEERHHGGPVKRVVMTIA